MPVSSDPQTRSISPADVSVIVPVGGGAPTWERCFEALRDLDPVPGEIIAVFDGPGNEGREQTAARGARVVRLDRRGGPARARNEGARAARGEVLLFVDSDVEVPPDLVGRVARLFTMGPDLAAVIGSYDDAPGDPGFFSQYRNLLHHYVHQHGREDASTFWGACGAVRRAVFVEAGGFDESYPLPSIEDIELGSRLKREGRSIRLVKDLQVKHLKRWRPGEMLSTDLLRRAVPWSELMLRRREMANDLNVRMRDRASVFFAWLLVVSLATCGLDLAVGGGASALSVLALVSLNLDLFRFFVRARGWLFALVVVPWYWIYLLICGLGFVMAWFRCLGSCRAMARERRRGAP